MKPKIIENNRSLSNGEKKKQYTKLFKCMNTAIDEFEERYKEKVYFQLNRVHLEGDEKPFWFDGFIRVAERYWYFIDWDIEKHPTVDWCYDLLELINLKGKEITKEEDNYYD